MRLTKKLTSGIIGNTLLITFIVLNVIIIWAITNGVKSGALVAGIKTTSNKVLESMAVSTPAPKTFIDAITPTPESLTPKITDPKEYPQTTEQVQGTNTTVNTTTVDCVGPDGKHMQVTQEECTNFNNAWKNTTPIKISPVSQQQIDSAKTSGRPTVTCSLSGTTYMLLPEDCEAAKKRDAELQVMKQQNEQAYQQSKQKIVQQEAEIALEKLQQAEQQFEEKKQMNENNYTACTADAARKFTTTKQSAQMRFGGTSAVEAIAQLAGEEYSRDVVSCASRFPH